jgi:hypothetical protein
VPSTVSIRRAAALFGVALLVTACDALTSDPVRSPLDGLSYVANGDSAGNTPPPPPPGPLEPGYVHGTVLGPWEGAGSPGDTLANSPRVAGVVVAAYRLAESGTVTPDNLGEIVASTVTAADGKFTLPTIAGGSYAVTFTPPAGSIYGGVWVTASIHATSHEFPWWVVLWKKSP